MMENKDPDWIACADFTTMKNIVWDNMFGRITPQYQIKHNVVGLYVNSLVSWVALIILLNISDANGEILEHVARL